MSGAWDADPVVITVAVTGADVFRENNPNIPYTTKEIAESSIEAAGAGATVVHDLFDDVVCSAEVGVAKRSRDERRLPMQRLRLPCARRVKGTGCAAGFTERGSEL